MATSVITTKNSVITRSIEKTDYLKSTIKEDYRHVFINSTLPYRIRFTNVIVPGYNPNNIPGIGLQVIGFSNWIL
jgi:hypothetical protein